MTEQLFQAFYTPTASEQSGSIYITWAGTRVCDAQHTIGPRVLPYYKAVLVSCGSGYFSLDGQEIRLNKGDLFFLFPNVLHHYRADPQNPWILQWFAYNGSAAQDMMQTLHVTSQRPILRGCMTRRLADCMNAIRACMEEDRARPWGMIGCAYQFFDEILHIQRNESPDQGAEMGKKELLQRALSFIDLNYTAELNVDVMCEYLHYSRSFFSHFFKAQMGVSLPEYINQRRIRQAQRLLEGTAMSLPEIALSVGYGDTLYFLKTFKRITGMTPTAYAREVQPHLQAKDNE